MIRFWARGDGRKEIPRQLRVVEETGRMGRGDEGIYLLPRGEGKGTDDEL